MASRTSLVRGLNETSFKAYMIDHEGSYILTQAPALFEQVSSRFFKNRRRVGPSKHHHRSSAVRPCRSEPYFCHCSNCQHKPPKPTGPRPAICLGLSTCVYCLYNASSPSLRLVCRKAEISSNETVNLGCFRRVNPPLGRVQ